MSKITMVTVVGLYVSLHGGRLQLTAEQARPRAHRLSPAGKTQRDGTGLYDIVSGPIDFMRDETFGIEGGVPMALERDLLDLNAAREAEQAAARQAAEENAAREAQKQAAARANQEHQALVAALASVQGDAAGNVSAEHIHQALAAAKLDFTPTHEQAEAAWQEVVDARLKSS